MKKRDRMCVITTGISDLGDDGQGIQRQPVKREFDVAGRWTVVTGHGRRVWDKIS